MNIQDKVVLVTGASEGIGKALAEALSRKGAKLVLAARSKDKIQALAQNLPHSIGVPTDLMKPSDTEALIEAALKKYGRIDILINNAGIGLYGTVENVNVDDYHQMMQLNVFAPLQAMQLVIPHMRKNGGGMIVNISSMVSKNAYPTLGAYASTKYALNALSLTARNELAAENIVVSLFHPKMTATRFGENAMGARPAFSSASTSARPMVDTAEEVAEKIIELIHTEAPEANM